MAMQGLQVLCALAVFCAPMALAWWLLARRPRRRDALRLELHD